MLTAASIVLLASSLSHGPLPARETLYGRDGTVYTVYRCPGTVKARPSWGSRLNFSPAGVAAGIAVTKKGGL